jgi:S-DNA-T family DNA segregation ATPase FtsK/SpoIIIE
MSFRNIYVKLRLRKQIIDAFKHAAVYHSYKYDNKTRYVYPKIHSINWNNQRVRYVFTLPNGVNPNKVKENEWVFKQIFGEYIELSGKYKKFILKSYYDGLPENVDYDYEEFLPYFKDKEDKEMTLPIILGKDLNGEVRVYDMDKQPHALFTGETGSGKSTLIHAIITTLIQYKKPEELRFVLGDLKRAEFGVYRNVKHVNRVCVNEKTLLPALQKVKAEMDRRGDLLDQYDTINHVKNLPEKLPYILVIIDEVAMLKKNKKIREIIEEISAIGRSLGVQLLLSMQRADHTLMDGALKNNLTVRVSGRQSNESNSRIAGVPNAHDIELGQSGRMIIMLDKPIQFKSTYLDLSDVEEIIQPYKKPIDKNKVPEKVKEFKFGVLDNEKKG